jgi:uncharacterized protein
MGVSSLLVLGLTLAGLVLLRGFVHWLILRGLRAPRLAHQRTPADLGFNALELRLPSVGGAHLFAWFALGVALLMLARAAGLLTV